MEKQIRECKHCSADLDKVKSDPRSKQWQGVEIINTDTESMVGMLI